MRGYALQDIEFLRRYPFVTDVVSVFPISGPFDLSPIPALTELRSLTISGPVPLALGRFSRLKTFRGNWDHKLDLSGCNLEILELGKYRAKSPALTELPEPPVLRELSIVQSAITSLHGVAKFRSLKKLELAYLSKLEKLSELDELPRLTMLDCNKCRKLRNHATVQDLENLTNLRFNDCGEIPTLAFLNKMKKLEDFRFVNTNVLDGDLTPLLRLESVGFLRKRHYSHTPEQIDSLLAARNVR
jgi:protein phosphatase 1 regulatory subunit 7